MTFGPGAWGVDEAGSRAIFDAYRATGGNFVDTADIYGGGSSEEFVGKFIRDTKSRDEIVLATKFGFNGSRSPLAAGHDRAGNPHAGGAGSKNIHRALDASLTRLGVDVIDLYWMHVWDGVTPVEEIVQTLSNLVQAAAQSASGNPSQHADRHQSNRRPEAADMHPAAARLRKGRGQRTPKCSHPVDGFGQIYL